MDWDAAEYAVRSFVRDFHEDLAEDIFHQRIDLTWDELTTVFIDSYNYFMSK